MLLCTFVVVEGRNGIGACKVDIHAPLFGVLLALCFAPSLSLSIYMLRPPCTPANQPQFPTFQPSWHCTWLCCFQDMSLRMNAGRTGFPGFFGDLVGSKLSQGSESRTLEQEVHRVMDQNEQLFILPGFIDRVLAFPMYLVLQSRIPEDLSVRMGEKRAKEIHALQVKLQREIYTVTAKKTEQGAAPVVAFIEAHSVIRKSFLDSITPLEKVDYYLVGMLGGKAIRPVSTN
mmetsp:Transcript_8892/g.24152  ORF Transcript_8892/g.24152 Transcript_8892/m.24152 type:complete len:231 (+) Transcript_8892:912-1604(+)